MNQISYFLVLCEEKSFTRASRRCGISQPSLTNAIKRLEAKLGGELFYRSRPEVRLTTLGRLVEPPLRQIRQEAVRAFEVAKRFGG